jgi:hypothetical protein
MLNLKGQTFRTYVVVASFSLQTLCLSPLYADGPTVDPKKNGKSQQEFEEFQKWKETRQATDKNGAASSGSSGTGKTLAIVGGVGLGVTYLTTLIVGLVGPSSQSKDYLIPVAGPFIQSGKVASPYDTLNILSGVVQTGFLATLVTGLILGSGSESAPQSGKVSIVPLITPRQQGVILGWSL